MARSVLKPHATLFATVLRASDPVVAVIAGIIAYDASLGGWSLPERCHLFLIGAAFGVAALFPLFRLYEPQRGISGADEFRRLFFAWLLIAAIVAATLFVTKSGDAFSR